MYIPNKIKLFFNYVIENFLNFISLIKKYILNNLKYFVNKKYKKKVQKIQNMLSWKKKYIVQIWPLIWEVTKKICMFIPVIILSIVFIFFCLFLYHKIYLYITIFEETIWYFIIRNKTPDAMHQFVDTTYCFFRKGWKNTLSNVKQGTDVFYMSDVSRNFFFDAYLHKQKCTGSNIIWMRRYMQRSSYFVAYQPLQEWWNTVVTWNTLQWNTPQWTSEYYKFMDIHHDKFKYSWYFGNYTISGLHFEFLNFYKQFWIRVLNFDFLHLEIRRYLKPGFVEKIINWEFTRYSYSAVFYMFVCVFITSFICDYMIYLAALKKKKTIYYGKEKLKEYLRLYRILKYFDRLLEIQYSNLWKYEQKEKQPIVRFGIFYKQFSYPIYIYIIFFFLINYHIGYLCSCWDWTSLLLWIYSFSFFADRQYKDFFLFQHIAGSQKITNHCKKLEKKKIFNIYTKNFAILDILTTKSLERKEQKYAFYSPRVLYKNINKSIFWKHWSIKTFSTFKKFGYDVYYEDTASCIMNTSQITIQNREYMISTKLLRKYRVEYEKYDGSWWVKRVKNKNYWPHKKKILDPIINIRKITKQEYNNVYRLYLGIRAYNNKFYCNQWKVQYKFLINSIHNLGTKTKYETWILQMFNTKNRYFILSDFLEDKIRDDHYFDDLAIGDILKTYNGEEEFEEEFEEDSYIMEDPFFPKEWKQEKYYEYEKNTQMFLDRDDDVNLEDGPDGEPEEGDIEYIYPIDDSIRLFYMNETLPMDSLILARENDKYAHIKYTILKSILYEYETQTDEVDYTEAFSILESDPIFRNYYKSRKNRLKDYVRYLRDSLFYWYPKFKDPRPETEEEEKLRKRLGKEKKQKYFRFKDIRLIIPDSSWKTIFNYEWDLNWHHYRIIKVNSRGEEISRTKPFFEPPVNWRWYLEKKYFKEHRWLHEDRPKRIKKVSRNNIYMKRKFRNWFDLNYNITSNEVFNYEYRWNLFTKSKEYNWHFNKKMNTKYPKFLKKF